MRKSSSVFFTILLLFSVGLATFQNCAPYQGQVGKSPYSSEAPSGLNPTPTPTPTPSQLYPSVSFSAVQALRGQAAITVTVVLANVDKAYTLNWLISGAGSDFNPGSGSFTVPAGATQATFTFASIAAAGSGNKSYTLNVAEASATLFMAANALMITDTTPPPAIAAGTTSACSATNFVTKCWGDNSKGQLGTGDTTSHNIPVVVTGLTKPLTRLSASEGTACGIAEGAVHCWGDNSRGLFGNGTTTSSTSPVAAPAPLSSNVQQISVGPVHACAIIAGAAYCWGNNKHGQLGTGSMSDTSQLSPVAVPGLNSGVTWISAGYYMTCAVHNGVGKCWGWGENGQLGNNDSMKRDASTPQAVSGASSGVTRISAGGYHACAIVSGAPKCWGSNVFGELGDGTQIDKLVATSVMNLTSATEIVTGREHTCAISSGAAWCWGYNERYSVGDGTTTNRKSPGRVLTLSTGVTAISASALGDVTCAIANNNFVCWGVGTSGQRGNGTMTDGAP